MIKITGPNDAQLCKSNIFAYTVSKVEEPKDLEQVY
jgi:hypothetical protein